MNNMAAFQQMLPPPPQGRGMSPQMPQQMSPQMLAQMMQQGRGAPQQTPPQMPPQAPPQAPPQIPPQMLAQLMQQQGRGGAPMMAPRPQPAMQQPPQGGGGAPQNIQLMVQQLASMGRFGDTQIAHLTPGEIQVPPQVQTPKVLATLEKAFDKKDIPLEKFTAGHPAASVNPQTGMQEFNFWSTFLPVALGVAGAAFGGPAIAGALGSSALAGSSIGGALGSTIGNIAVGQDTGQAIAGGIGSGLLGYGAGSLFGAGANAAGQAAGAGNAAGSSAGNALATGAMNAAPMTALSASGAPMSTTASLAGGAAPAAGGFFSNLNIPQAVGSYIGGQLGSSLAAPTPKSSPMYPRGFNEPLPPVGQLPPFNEALGQTSYNGPRADFTNYNPLTNSPAAYNFFPTR